MGARNVVITDVVSSHLQSDPRPGPQSKLKPRRAFWGGCAGGSERQPSRPAGVNTRYQPDDPTLKPQVHGL